MEGVQPRESVKATLQAAEKTRERAEQNVSIRKQKREDLMRRRRFADAAVVNDSLYNQRMLTPAFLELVKVDLKQAVLTAWQRMQCTNDSEIVLCGIQEMDALLCHKAKHNYLAVYDLIDRSAFCKQLCQLLKTKDAGKQEHVMCATVVLHEIVTVTKNHEAEWDHALLDAGLFPHVVGVHMIGNPNASIRKYMYYVSNNFVAKCYNNAIHADMTSYWIQCLEQTTKTPAVIPFVAWYVAEMLGHKPGVDWERHGKPFYTFIVETLKGDADSTTYIDLLDAVKRCSFRGEIFENLVDDIGMARLAGSFLNPKQDKEVVVGVLELLCQCNKPKYVRQCFEHGARFMYQWLEANERPMRGPLLTLCGLLSQCGEKDAVRLVETGFIEIIAKKMLDVTCSDSKLLQAIVRLMNNVCSYLIHYRFSESALYEKLFASGFVIYNLCKQLRMPFPDICVSILEILQSILVWECKVAKKQYCKNQLQDNDDIIFIGSDLQYKNTNSQVNAAAANVVDAFGEGDEYFNAMDLDDDGHADDDLFAVINEQYSF